MFYVVMIFSFLFNLFVRVSTTSSDEQTGMKDDARLMMTSLTTIFCRSFRSLGLIPLSARKPLLKSILPLKVMKFVCGCAIKEAPLIKTS